MDISGRVMNNCLASWMRRRLRMVMNRSPAQYMVNAPNSSLVTPISEAKASMLRSSFQ